MAKITLDNLAHSYYPNPKTDEDFALKELNLDWVDGEAYALLGSSGCGKSTLLNIISGLLQPSQGRILFNDRDVTDSPTAQRNIAQVFQFPVVYDTMTVRNNLAFPLRNRGADSNYIQDRVQWSPTGTNVPDYPKLAQLWWQNIGDASSGAKSAQEALDSLCAEQEKVLARIERAGVQGDLGPLLNDESDADFWLSQPGSPKAKLTNEREVPQTIDYDELIQSWQ